jgi:hypothetical protein
MGVGPLQYAGNGGVLMRSYGEEYLISYFHRKQYVKIFYKNIPPYLFYHISSLYMSSP